MTAPHLSPGQVIAGRYTVHGLLGYTGEVATYHAVSAQGDVALKLYDPAIGQRGDIMGRLDQIRDLLSRVSPEHVVPIIDAGFDTSTSAPFLVSELLTMPSLAKLAQMGPLSAEVVGAVVAGVARALDAAAAVGLHHLSLKPTNVFVGPAPAYPVRLTDFVDAVVYGASPTHEAYAQAAPWWAPEQMRPGAALGGQTDVFAVALMSFYALTGKSYWMSCQTHPPDLPAWQMEAMGARKPASERARELGAFLNPGIDGVFGRAISVTPSDRPHSATELAGVLMQIAGPAAIQGATTMAFPEEFDPAALSGGGAQPSSGGYAPAPQPSTVYGTPSPLQQSQPGQAPPAQSSQPGQPYAAPGSQPGQAAGGYAGGYAAPAQDLNSTVLADPNAPTPGLPPFPQPVPAKKKEGNMLPVIIGVVGAVVISLIVVLVLLLRSPADSDATAAAASASGSVEAPAGSAPAADPKPTEGAEPVEVEDPAPAPSAAPSAEASDGKSKVTFECEPRCTSIIVDGKKIALKPEKEGAEGQLELPPGKVKVDFRRHGYFPKRYTFEIKAGEPFKKRVTLKRAPVQPRRRRRRCGQFLKCR